MHERVHEVERDDGPHRHPDPHLAHQHLTVEVGRGERGGDGGRAGRERGAGVGPERARRERGHRHVRGLVHGCGEPVVLAGHVLQEGAQVPGRARGGAGEIGGPDRADDVREGAGGPPVDLDNILHG
ncbi:hypothetical protein BJF78_34890 [Pseudonocardia sp. CNS-139]|nr:hypothetical protein BJF78_34890 [Pseudonocardia sp. CNS-139]